jgi:hypothetical protein
MRKRTIIISKILLFKCIYEKKKYA